MIFRPAPPSLNVAGPLPTVVDQLRRRLDAEARFSWEAPEGALVLTSDGRLEAGPEYEPSPFEVDGFKTLITRYNDAFPRAFGLLSALSNETAAAAWAELYRGYPREGRLLVAERHSGGGASAIYGVYPTGYPVEYTVGSVAEAVQEGCVGIAGPIAGPMARLVYDAGPSTLALTVELPEFDLCITANDVYGEASPAVTVIGKDGKNYGQPPVGPARRRRPGTGGASTSEGIIEKIRAASAFYHGRRGASGRAA